MRCSPRKVTHLLVVVLVLWTINMQLLSPWTTSTDEEVLQKAHDLLSYADTPLDSIDKLRNVLSTLQLENAIFLNDTISAILAKNATRIQTRDAATQRLIESVINEFDSVSKSLDKFRNYSSMIVNQTRGPSQPTIKEPSKPLPPQKKHIPPAPRIHRKMVIKPKKAVIKTKWDKNHTWPAPVSCPPKFGYHGPGTLARTALASMEGSGNTWLRHMLQIATGIWTGSVYRDKYLVANGFPAEFIQDGRVVVIKTHDRNTSVHKKYDKVVLLLRSPYDTFLAELNRLYSNQDGNHTAYADPKIFKDGTSDWEISFMGEKWRNFSKNWLQFPGPLAVVHYEDFQTDFRNETTKLLRFLQFEVTDSQLDCVVSNNEGKFHRKKKQLGFDPFTEKHKRELEDHKAAIQNFIEERQKKGLPTVI